MATFCDDGISHNDNKWEWNIDFVLAERLCIDRLLPISAHDHGVASRDQNAPEELQMPQGVFKCPRGSSIVHQGLQITLRVFNCPSGSSNAPRVLQMPRKVFKCPSGSSNTPEGLQLPQVGARLYHGRSPVCSEVVCCRSTISNAGWQWALKLPRCYIHL